MITRICTSPRIISFLRWKLSVYSNFRNNEDIAMWRCTRWAGWSNSLNVSTRKMKSRLIELRRIRTWQCLVPSVATLGKNVCPVFLLEIFQSAPWEVAIVAYRIWMAPVNYRTIQFYSLSDHVQHPRVRFKVIQRTHITSRGYSWILNTFLLLLLNNRLLNNRFMYRLQEKFESAMMLCLLTTTSSRWSSLLMK